MKKADGIALSIAAVCLALGVGVITGGTLVAPPAGSSTTAPPAAPEPVPDVPARALADRKVLIIATPAANRDTIEQIHKQVTGTAGKVTGLITLTPKFAATENDVELSTLLTTALPQGVQLPTDRDQNSGRLTGAIVGSLAGKPDTPEGDEIRSAFMDRLSANGFITADSFLGAANCAIVVTGGVTNGAAPNSELGARGVTVAKVGEGLAQRQVPTVVAGATGSSDVNGPLAAAQQLQTKQLATVTNVDTKAGQATVVLRLAKLTQ